MRIAIFVANPSDTCIRDLYYSLAMTEALVAGGHTVYFCTNRTPDIYSYFETFPHHHSIHLVLTHDFIDALPSGSFDAVVLTPCRNWPGYNTRVELFSIERGAHLILTNSNLSDSDDSSSGFFRRQMYKTAQKRIAANASAILSTSKEGNNRAKEIYTSRRAHTGFDYCYPPINTYAADSVLDEDMEDRIFLPNYRLISDPEDTTFLGELFCEVMRGYTLVIVVGKDEIPSGTLGHMIDLAKQYGVHLKLRRDLNDVEKFREIKRAKLVLFPSLCDNYVIPPVEAQYCNVRCVAFDLPALRETCGDRVYWAKHGDWTSFRDKIREALTCDHATSEFNAVIAPVASLKTATERLGKILEGIAEMPLPPRTTRYRWLRIRQQLSMNRFRLRKHNIRIRVGNFLIKCCTRLVPRGSHQVSYYPRFDSSEELTSHYYRAHWYLPYVQGHCEKVSLFPLHKAAIGPLPEYMAAPESKSDHIHLKRGTLRFILSLLRADLILVWKQEYTSRYLAFFGRVCNKKIVNVATDDLGAKEYGAYCSLIWKELTSNEERAARIANHERKFNQIAQELRGKKFDRACVFGTGPSLARASEFVYGHSLNIVCNSIVQNESLLNILKPTFICAADVVSHLGVSRYAHQFRSDLFNVLKKQDTVFVTTAKYGVLILYHYPELEENILLLPQSQVGPNYDLQQRFGASQLDSTLNILMLPLAATFCKTIWLLGCDGKRNDGGNEDFWAHAETTQYYDLVDSGHRCHPTFDVHRQLSTYDRFLDSTRRTVEGGERDHGIEYISLTPSNIPCLQPREMNSTERATISVDSS